MQSDIFPVHAAIEQKHWWFVARRRIISMLVAHAVPPSQDAKLIDVGCGTGGNIAAFADRYRCVGIDPTPAAIELAREHFPGVEFICGHAPDDLGEHCQSANLLMLNDVLEHVPDDFDLLTKLWQAVRPGTYFLITVPADERLWSAHDESHQHYRRYDRQRLVRLWQDLPATPLLVSHMNWRLYPLIRAVRSLSRLRGKGQGVANSDLKMPSALSNWAFEKIFAGEANYLEKLVTGERIQPRGFGVSLVALLRREEGNVTPFQRPADVPADIHEVARS